MKKSLTYFLTAAFVISPFMPQLHFPNKQLAKDNIPFLKESTKNSKLSLTDLISHFKMMNLAHAGTHLTHHPTNNLRDSIGLAIGYGDHVAYGDLACDGNDPGVNTDCSGPPYDGIVGRLTTIINTLPSIGSSVGITDCALVPATGSATGTDSNGTSVTINFQTPTHSIPSPWTGGGTTFQKRVEFQETILGDVTKIAYEFNCGDSPSLYTAINMDMGTVDGHAYTRLITLYTGPVNTTKNGIEVYMAEYSSGASRLRAADAIRIEYTPTTDEFNLWGVMNTNLSSGHQIVSRSIIHGNYSTGAATVMYDGYEAPVLSGNDSAIDRTNTNAQSYALTSVYGLTNGTGAATDFDFNQNLNTASTYASPGEVYKKGCINFNTPNAIPSDTSDCTGLALTNTAAGPYVDGTGHFSIAWALATMPGKLEVIP